MALDTLRAAVWPPSDVPLDRAGRRLPGWRDRPVCIELYYRRRDRRFRSGMAVDCGGMVCAADGVPADRWMIFRVMEIWKTAARADGKAIHNLMEKDKPFPTGLQTAFPQPRNLDSLRTFPQRLLRRLSILSYPILMRKYYGNSFSTEVQFVPLFKQQNRVKVI